MHRARTCAIIAAVAGGAILTGAAPAGAAPHLETVTCGGQDLSIRVADNHSSDNGGWGAVQIVAGGSGTLIPVSFSGTAVDTTIGQTIFTFDSAKGDGNANHNQSTVTCTQTLTATLADFLEPGEQPPPGTSLTDQVVFTLTATVVQK